MLPCDCIVLQYRGIAFVHFERTVNKGIIILLASLLHSSFCCFLTQSLLLRLHIFFLSPLSSFPFLSKLTCGNSLKTPSTSLSRSFSSSFSACSSSKHAKPTGHQSWKAPHPLPAVLDDGQQVDRRGTSKSESKTVENKEIMKENWTININRGAATSEMSLSLSCV